MNTVSATEIKSLYKIKNVSKEHLVNLVDTYLNHSDYKVIYSDDFYVLSPSSDNAEKDFCEIILTASGSDCYLYYFSDNQNMALDKKLINNIKISNYKIKEIDSTYEEIIFKEKALELKEKAKQNFN